MVLNSSSLVCLTADRYLSGAGWLITKLPSVSGNNLIVLFLVNAPGTGFGMCCNASPSWFCNGADFEREIWGMSMIVFASELRLD